jgi:hypothetical protein
LEKSHKSSTNSNTLRNFASASIRFSTAALFVSAAVFVSPGAQAADPKPKQQVFTPSKPSTTQENHRDLVQKAQNLTLQHDRLQASQVLIRGIQREPKGSVAHKELMKALDELTSVFYTERAQSAFVAGESLVEMKPREAIDSYLEALRQEDGNLAVLKAVARGYLTLGECDKADTHVRSAEGLNPFSPEVILLRVQTLGCSKNSDGLEAKMSAAQTDLEPVLKYARGIEIKDLARRKEYKKAKALLASWETQSPGYPEVLFWKFELSRLGGGPVERTSAVQYSQACQNMTARARKSFNLDVELCKGKVAVDAYLRETGLKPAAPRDQELPNDG